MADRPAAASRAWRPAAPVGRAGAAARRRLLAAAVGAAALAVAGATLAWLFFLQRFDRPHFLPLCLSEYGRELPVRAWVPQDGQALQGFAWQKQNTFASQKRDLFLGDLGAFLRRAGRAPVVVYLNACALPSPKGELCLVPAGAWPGRPEDWVSLDKVFRLLRESPSRHKLLLIDVMQPAVQPSGGLLADDAAWRLQALLDKVLPEDPNLSVFTACAPGQVSLPAEELGHSVFAHFLVRGLRGEAEGRGSRGRKDGRIWLHELAAYVTEEVDRWALRHRGVRQTPRLQGAETDFELAQAEAAGAPAEEEPAELKYPDWLADVWKVRDAWWNDEAFRRAPQAYRELEQEVLRADRQWRAGIPEDLIRTDLQARLLQLQGQVDQHPRPVPPPPTSAVQALARDPKAAEAAAALLADLRRLSRQYAQLPAKPDPKDTKALEGDADKLVKEFKGPPAALAGALFEAAAAEVVPQAVLQFLHDRARKVEPPLPYSEMRTLGQLATLPAANPDDWPGPAVQTALQVVRAAAEAADGEAAAERWVKETRRRAEGLRGAGEALLFGRDPARRKDAQGPLQEALQTYLGVKSDLRTAEDALRSWDQARARLPGLALLPSEDGAWQNAYQAALALQEVLDVPVAPAGAAHEEQMRRLLDRTADLRHLPNSPNNLLGPLSEEQFRRRIERRGRADLADALQIAALLDTPWPAAAQRAEMWKVGREFAAPLDAQRRPTSLGPWDEQAAVAAERGRALHRARRSAEVLRLLGVGELEGLNKAQEQAAAKPDDDGRRWRLGEELRRAWGR
jgi:hypothetical protein